MKIKKNIKTKQRLKANKRIHLCWLVLFLNLFSYGSGVKESYDLDDLVKLLDRHSLLLRAAELDRHIAEEEYRAARALPNPEVELFKGEGKLFYPAERASLWGVGTRISIPNPIYRFFRLKSLKKTITEAEIEAEIKRKNVIKDLKTHYFRCQFSRKIASLLREKIERLREMNRITKARVSIGEAREIDYLRTSVEIQKGRSRLFGLQKTAGYERTKINEFLNYVLAKDFQVVEDFSFAPLAYIEDRIERLIDKSPFVVLKLNDLDIKKANLKASNHAFIGDIAVFGEREKEVEAEVWRLGVGLSLPIFNTGSASARKAKLEQEKARLEFEQAKKHLFADIDRMISEIRVLENEIETFTGAVLKEGRENMELSERLYREGEIPLVVFLDSQNSFFEIQQRYYEAISEWKILRAELEALLGEAL